MAKILIADDVSENRYLLMALLSGHGHEVVSATNGAEALALAEAAPPELIVTDILMPVMDGFELCRRWRLSERLRQIPFVIYTATYTEPSDERLALTLGADRFVVKPVAPDALLAVVNEVLAAGRRDGKGESAAADPVEVLRWHNQALVHKLEKKIQALEAEIAERHRLSDELEQSVAQLEVAGRIAKLGGWSLEPGSGVVSWSDEVAALYEVPPGGTHSLDALLGFYTAEHRSRVQAALDACAKDGTPGDLEAEGRSTSGRRVWVRTLCEARKDASGRVSRVHGATQDLTEQKRAEDERRTLREELFHSQKLESLGRLGAGVAHDVNNLLAVIMSYATLARESRRPGDPLLADLDGIVEAGEHAAVLTRQLLAFGRKQPFEPRPVDLNEVVTRTKGMLLHLSRRGVEIGLQLAEGVGPVMADPLQLEQVLVNLSMNAFDAMPQGGTLTLATAVETLTEAEARRRGSPGPGRYAVLTVKDTGSGMDAATRERAFEPFFTTKENGKGTGLGLSTVYGIVTRHGGHVSLETEPGRGSTFTVRFPLMGEGAPAHA